MMFQTVIELNSSIFSVTWSFWNIFNMCSWNISYYYQCL